MVCPPSLREKGFLAKRRRMTTQKLYAGAKLREVRTRIGLTQKDFAAKLGVSLPYLNQMENNNRPVSPPPPQRGAAFSGAGIRTGCDRTQHGRWRAPCL